MQIIGLFLVKNEDIYIERAVLNVLEFCDRIFIDDNESTDDTHSILLRLAERYEKIELRTIGDTIESNERLVPYFGSDTWIFAVDGDEIYDRHGLKVLKQRMAAGEFDDWFLILGNCFHVVEISPDKKMAHGYFSPPSKSMTKLYNFSLIEDFPVQDERLHGTPVFKDGGDAQSRWLHFYKSHHWQESCFRCVHTAFVQRTSKPAAQKQVFGIRLNPPQIYTLKKIWRDHSFLYALPRAAKQLAEIVLGIDSRVKRYKVGKRQKLDVSDFFQDQPDV